MLDYEKIRVTVGWAKVLMQGEKAVNAVDGKFGFYGVEMKILREKAENKACIYMQTTLANYKTCIA